MFNEEEEAFWLLIALMHDERWSLRDVMKPGFPGLLEHLFAFEKLFAQYLGALYEHLTDVLQISTAMYGTQWFLTLFSSVLPPQIVANLFDVFFLRGYAIVHQVALSVLALAEEQLLACDFDGAMLVLSNVASCIAIPDQILTVAHRRFGGVTPERIAALTEKSRSKNLESFDDISSTVARTQGQKLASKLNKVLRRNTSRGRSGT